RPHSRSTLFPYTTLFRSPCPHCQAQARISQVCCPALPSTHSARSSTVKGPRGAPGIRPWGGGDVSLQSQKRRCGQGLADTARERSEEHTSELQSLRHLVC